MNIQFNPDKWKILSPQQLAVIRWVYEGTGSLELLARAGCGKTFTLMKVVDAIVDGKFGDVALMAYNKKIADEIKSRLEDARRHNSRMGAKLIAPASDYCWSSLQSKTG